jgi:nucleotide-binding universal stress UspA family protein
VPAPSSVQGQSVTVAGWAVDLAAGSGTGVSAVHVWVLPNPGSGQPAQFLGAATYGGSRPDVAGAYGSQFQSSGYSISGTLAPGTYQAQVFAWSTSLAQLGIRRDQQLLSLALVADEHGRVQRFTLAFEPVEGRLLSVVRR